MRRGKVIALGVVVAVACGSIAFIVALDEAPRPATGHASGIAALIPFIALVPVLVATRRRRLGKTRNDG